MKNIVELVKDNKEEAIDIINDKGGRIDFVDVRHGAVDLDGWFDDDEDDWFGDIDKVNVPIVLMRFDGFPYKEMAVLAVKTSDKGIEMLVYAIGMEEVIGWYSTDDCRFLSENYIFEFIKNFLKNN